MHIRTYIPENGPGEHTFRKGGEGSMSGEGAGVGHGAHVAGIHSGKKDSNTVARNPNYYISCFKIVPDKERAPHPKLLFCNATVQPVSRYD